MQPSPVVPPPPVPTPTLPVEIAPPVQPTPPLETSNIIRLRSTPGFDVPAPKATSWSVTGAPFGTVSVVVPVGTTPREALTIALAEKGFQVVG
jgi:hypothetical protein